MKKLILPLLLALCLTSCGETDVKSNTDGETTPNASIETSDTAESEITATPESEDTTALETQAEPYIAELDCELSIEMGSDAENTLKTITDKLGEASDYMEAPSCIHEGSDRVYTFEGFTVTSSPDGSGGEYIAELTFISDAVGFSNGIMIGSSSSDVTNTFGENYEEKFGVRKYISDNVSITFIFDNDVATAISVSVN